MLGPPVDVLGEQLAAREVSRRTAAAGPARCADVASECSRIASWSSSGMPSSMPITRIGICAPRSATKSNRSAPDERIETVDAELPDLGLERDHLLRREHARQQPAVDRVRRRVLEDEDAGRHLDVRLDHLEDAAASGDDRSPRRRGRARRRRSDSPRRSRTARCSRAALRRAAAGTPGTDRRRCRRRTGRSRRPSSPSPSPAPPSSNSQQTTLTPIPGRKQRRGTGRGR